MQRFIQAKRRLDEECIEPFTGFALDGKRSLAKFMLFDLAERSRAAAASRSRPGRYSFELFVKSSNANRSPKLERSFEHVVEQKHARRIPRATSPVYLINYQMTLPERAARARRRRVDAAGQRQRRIGARPRYFSSGS